MQTQAKLNKEDIQMLLELCNKTPITGNYKEVNVIAFKINELVNKLVTMSKELDDGKQS